MTKIGSFLNTTLLTIKSVVRVMTNREMPSIMLYVFGLSAYAVKLTPMAHMAVMDRIERLNEGKKNSDE